MLGYLNSMTNFIQIIKLNLVMKKTVALILGGILCINTYSQKAVTNKEGSSYRFEEMAHLDANSECVCFSDP